MEPALCSKGSTTVYSSLGMYLGGTYEVNRCPDGTSGSCLTLGQLKSHVIREQQRVPRRPKRLFHTVVVSLEIRVETLVISVLL
jgi:hypothetical protein